MDGKGGYWWDKRLEKRAAESARRAAITKKMTFAEAADRYIAIQEPGWRNPKHAWQWRNSLDKYVIPKIGRLDVGDIGIAQVLSVLEPIWQTTTETASRVRVRIELILAWADKRAERERLNPARWRGHLDTQLPRPSKVARPKHHKAPSLAEMPLFITCLRDQDSMAARALEFAILTAARSGEVRHATWSELDLASKVWTIPAERMKGGRRGLRAARLSIDLQGLVRRAHERIARGRGDGVGPCHQQRSGSRLPAR